jgi:hypothetical protein
MAEYAMQHTYSPKARAMRYVSVVIVPCHRLDKLPSQYIGIVLQDRLISYDPAPEPGILGINSVENGVFKLSKDLHALFGSGESTFIKVHAAGINADIL